MKTTKTFKSGNSIAVRLPKALGIEAGDGDARSARNRAQYVLEPVKKEKRDKIDLSRYLRLDTGLKRIERDDDDL